MYSVNASNKKAAVNAIKQRLEPTKRSKMKSTYDHITLVDYLQQATIIALERVRAIALEKAIKYRFDPMVKGIHQMYLDEITEIMEEYND